MENKYISFDDLQDILESAFDKAMDEYIDSKGDFEFAPMDVASKALVCNMFKFITDTLDEYRNELLMESEDD